MRLICSSFIIFLLASSSLVYAQDTRYPIVKGFGGIYEIPNSENPDPAIEYKIVIDLKTMQRDKESINRGLNNVARMLNLHGLGGIRPENLKVTVAIHGGATDVILTNEAYQKRYEVDNPNIALILALKETGVEIYVCGQSLLSREYQHEDVNPDVAIGLSMLTVVTTKMHQGYQLLVFD